MPAPEEALAAETPVKSAESEAPKETSEEDILTALEKPEELPKQTSEKEENLSDNKQDATALFTLSAIESLSHLSTEELSTMTVKDAVALITSGKKSDAWIESSLPNGSQKLEANYSFSDPYVASNFLSVLYRQSEYTKTPLENLSLYNQGNTWKVNVSVLSEDAKALTPKEVQLTKYADFKYENSLENKQLFSEGETTTQAAPYELKGNPSAIPLQVLSNGDRKIIKVPIAVLGKWKHPKYGDLEFSQQDFDEMKANVESRVLGYEPPLYLGHIEKLPGRPEHPADGFISRVVQEGPVLFGEYDVVNDQTYNLVSKGQFRYSSGEFLRDHVSKKTGTRIGTTLVGLALTNRPFLTGMPRVTTLSEDTQSFSTLLLTDSFNQMTTNNTSDPTFSTEVAQLKKELLSEFNSVKQQYNDAQADLQQKLTEAEATISQVQTNLSEVTTERDSLAQKIQDIQAANRQKEVDQKLSDLEALPLPVEQKQKYSELIKNGSLGDNEDVILSSLKEMSTNLTDAVTTQHGAERATHALNDPAVGDPYATTITRNEEIAKAKAASLLQKLQ